ncbi:MAG: SusC/RagA family TonB-linked outer membrane protein [Sphingobacteriia bacterium]|nr:SusC/RagA family TonB-linked outer membrane protein [Sphingobacteriia bacterium]
MEFNAHGKPCRGRKQSGIPALGGINKKQLLMSARMIGIFLLMACLQISARSLAQVSLSEKKAPLEKVLQAIKKQSGYELFYDVKLLRQKSLPVDIVVQNVSVEQALQLAFKNQPLTYEIIEGRIISVKEKPASPKPEATEAVAPPQNIDVHGVVRDENGKPLAGVIVKVKGSTKATATNDKGEFELKGIEPNATIIVTAINIETIEAKLNGRTELAFTAIAKTNVLEDVVVNKGYYITTQKLNTGSVSTVKAAQIERQPVGNISTALESLVPGLQMTTSTGLPGRTAVTYLRGINTISSGRNPLYLVDGVPINPATMDNLSMTITVGINSNPLNSINPQDVESVEVLKDADATAIYGSRGANGVILITTKKGKAGKTRLDVNMFSGSGKANKLLHFLNKDQFLSLRHEAFANDGVSVFPANAYDLTGQWDTTRYTDWQKYFIGGSSKTTSAQVSVSGGNENTTFLIGGNYYRETTIFPGNFYDVRYSVHSNISHVSPNKKFKLNLSSSYSYDLSMLPQNDLTRYINISPVAPALFDSIGRLNWQNSTWANPYQYILNWSKGITEYLTSNLNFSYELLPGLQFRSNIGYSTQTLDQTQIFPLAGINPASGSSSSSSFATLKRKSISFEPQIDYVHQFGKAKIQASFGGSYIFQKNTGNALKATVFSTDGLIENPQAATTIAFLNSTYSVYKHAGAFARINYDWDSRYIVNITADRDASTRFGTGNQFANFGAIGVAWIFSNENFFKRSSGPLTFGKIRASIGTTGNDQIADYQFLDTYGPYSYPYQGYSTLMPQRLQNVNLSWEKTSKFEIGLELGFYKDRLRISGDYYSNQSSNQLLNNGLPTITGFSSIVQNLPATIQNNGFEFQVNSKNIKSKNFNWESVFHISIPKNKLVAYPGFENSSFTSTYVVGQPMFISLNTHYTGVDPQTGIYTVEDLDKDGKITFPNDYKYIVNTSQQFFGSIQNSFNYKSWSLDFNIQFVRHDNQANYFNSPFTVPIQVATNQLDYVLDRWRSPGQITNVQKVTNSNSLVSNGFAYMQSSDLRYSNGSFIRLKNIYLSYQLNPSMTQKWGIQNMKLYVSAQNLFTITSFNKGLDPETGNASPILSVIAAGIKLSL